MGLAQQQQQQHDLLVPANTTSVLTVLQNKSAKESKPFTPHSVAEVADGRSRARAHNCLHMQLLPRQPQVQEDSGSANSGSMLGQFGKQFNPLRLGSS